jgi:hypothetical protein
MSRSINAPTLTAAQAAALGIPTFGPNPDFGNISRYEGIGEWLCLSGAHAAATNDPVG